MAGGGGGKGKSSASALNVNLTPMIDCTMLLVIFFLMTTQLASPDFSDMKVPKPTNSVAQEFKEGNKAVVQVVPWADSDIRADATRANKAMEYRVGLYHFQKNDLNGLITKVLDIRKVAKSPKDFRVEIRADKRLDFTEVEPIFAALQAAQLRKVHVTAIAPSQAV